MVVVLTMVLMLVLKLMVMQLTISGGQVTSTYLIIQWNLGIFQEHLCNILNIECFNFATENEQQNIYTLQTKHFIWE